MQPHSVSHLYRIWLCFIPHWGHCTIHQESIPSITPSKRSVSTSRAHLCTPLQLSSHSARTKVCCGNTSQSLTLQAGWFCVRGMRGVPQYSARRTTERGPHFLPSAPASAPVSLAKCTFFTRISGFWCYEFLQCGFEFRFIVCTPIYSFLKYQTKFSKHVLDIFHFPWHWTWRLLTAYVNARQG